MIISTIARLVAFMAILLSVAASAAKDWKRIQILVLYDPELVTETSSLNEYFQLSPDGYQITYTDYSDDKEEIFSNGEPMYDHIVYLPLVKPSSASKQLVNKHTLLDYFNAGGNVLAIGSSENSVPEEVRLFLNQAGIYPAPKGFLLDNHFSPGNVISGDHLVSKSIVSNIELINYQGTAALISNSELLVPIVRAPKLSFTSDHKDEVLTSDRTWTFGEQGYLAVAFQGLNNARGAWIGSMDLLSRDLLSWVFQAKGVLNLQFAHHYKKSEPGVTGRTLYRIKDDVYYTVGISEFQDGKWVPFTPKTDDQTVQLTFKMLDPYQRLNMTLLGPGSSEENGENDLNIFYVEFKLPDHHGMFTYELDYKREGLSFLEDKQIVTVRHLANDEFKRSWLITNAWMYITSAATVVGAWLLFVTLFLFLGETKRQVTVEKKMI